MVEVTGNYAVFRFFRPSASSVHLVGDFNRWRANELKMTPKGGGWWQASLLLPAGMHKFRYLADGQWYTDFAAFGVEWGPFGPDSTLHVPMHRPVLARRAVPQPPRQRKIAESGLQIAAA